MFVGIVELGLDMLVGCSDPAMIQIERPTNYDYTSTDSRLSVLAQRTSHDSWKMQCP